MHSRPERTCPTLVHTRMLTLACSHPSSVHPPPLVRRPKRGATAEQRRLLRCLAAVSPRATPLHHLADRRPRRENHHPDERAAERPAELQSRQSRQSRRQSRPSRRQSRQSRASRRRRGARVAAAGPAASLERPRAAAERPRRVSWGGERRRRQTRGWMVESRCGDGAGHMLCTSAPHLCSAPLLTRLYNAHTKARACGRREERRAMRRVIVGMRF
jgi:hypothetical protein